MVKTLTGLLPLAVGLVVFLVVVWFLLGRGSPLGKWAIAAFLVGHGLVHVMFAVPRPAGATASASGVDYPFDPTRSWLIGGAGIDANVVRGLVVALVVALVIGYLLAALATVGLLVPEGAWGPLVIGATAVSLVLLGVTFSPGLVLGVAIDVVLLWVVLAAAWTPRQPFAVG